MSTVKKYTRSATKYLIFVLVAVISWAVAGAVKVANKKASIDTLYTQNVLADYPHGDGDDGGDDDGGDGGDGGGSGDGDGSSGSSCTSGTVGTAGPGTSSTSSTGSTW